MKTKRTLCLLFALLFAALTPLTCFAAAVRRYYGDVDGDGAVTTTDARICLRIAAKLDTAPTGIDFKACDIDGNGKIMTDDARTILRMAAQLVDKVFLDGSGAPGDILSLMNEINALRESKSVTKLVSVPGICGAASVLAREFSITGNTVYRPGGAYWYTALRAQNVIYIQADADYYKGSEDVQFVLRSLSSDAQAHSNILNTNYTKFGVGCFVGTDAYYWCVIYIQD